MSSVHSLFQKAKALTSPRGLAIGLASSAVLSLSGCMQYPYYYDTYNTGYYPTQAYPASYAISYAPGASTCAIYTGLTYCYDNMANYYWYMSGGLYYRVNHAPTIAYLSNNWGTMRRFAPPPHDHWPVFNNRGPSPIMGPAANSQRPAAPAAPVMRGPINGGAPVIYSGPGSHFEGPRPGSYIPGQPSAPAAAPYRMTPTAPAVGNPGSGGGPMGGSPSPSPSRSFGGGGPAIGGGGRGPGGGGGHGGGHRRERPEAKILKSESNFV